jgi:phage FluMu gp28-like protein
VSQAAPKFLRYQSRWIRDSSRLKLMEKCRQVGLSWSTAYRLSREAGKKDSLFDFWVSSRDELQARLFNEDCKGWAKVLQIAATDMGVQIIDEEKKHSAHVLQFANGRRIHSMSSNPDAQAGKRGSRCLDEFALHPDPRKLWSIAYPGITWGGSMEVISTHRGSVNFFNQLVLEIKEGNNPKGISLHTVTLQDALDDGFLDKLKTKLPEDDARQQMDAAAYFDFIRSGCASEEDFLQEYMCVPADDASAFLAYDLIDPCQYLPGEVWALPLDRAEEIYVGVDVGREHDLTVFWILEKSGTMLNTRRIDTYQGTTFSDQEAALWQILERPNVRRCCIDKTGLGMMFAERAAERFPGKVEGVMFTASTKERLAYPLRGRFEDRSIRIPNDPKIMADLRAVKKVQSAGGNVRFAADRGKNGHADRFWALALAIDASQSAGAVPPLPTAFPSRRGAAYETKSRREVLA